MSDRARILFVLEGKRPERGFVDSLEREFLGVPGGVKCTFDSNIYQLYRAMRSDGGVPLDLVSVLRERNPRNREALEGYGRGSFAYTYLFFDYDGHATEADDGVLAEMLSYFNNETERGLLLVSYPMAEALRHYRGMEEFRDLSVEVGFGHAYKSLVAEECRPQLCNIHRYTGDLWAELTAAHLRKMNLLTGGGYTFPVSVPGQLAVFEAQRAQYLSLRPPRVAVLSAFPMFVLEYFGCAGARARVGAYADM